jgi:hypothetical protein
MEIFLLDGMLSSVVVHPALAPGGSSEIDVVRAGDGAAHGADAAADKRSGQGASAG